MLWKKVYRVCNEYRVHHLLIIVLINSISRKGLKTLLGLRGFSWYARNVGERVAFRYAEERSISQYFLQGNSMQYAEGSFPRYFWIC